MLWSTTKRRVRSGEGALKVKLDNAFDEPDWDEGVVIARGD